MRSDAYHEGQEAAIEGLQDCDCPYPIGSDEAMDWQDGLSDANTQSKAAAQRHQCILKLMWMHKSFPHLARQYSGHPD